MKELKLCKQTFRQLKNMDKIKGGETAPDKPKNPHCTPLDRPCSIVNGCHTLANCKN